MAFQVAQWSKPVLGSSAGFCFSQEAGLVLEFPLQPSLSESLLGIFIPLRVFCEAQLCLLWKGEA